MCDLMGENNESKREFSCLCFADFLGGFFSSENIIGSIFHFFLKVGKLALDFTLCQYRAGGRSFGRREMEHIWTISQMGDGRYISSPQITPSSIPSGRLGLRLFLLCS